MSAGTQGGLCAPVPAAEPHHHAQPEKAKTSSLGRRAARTQEAERGGPEAASLRMQGAVPDTLLCLQHTPAYTVGTRGAADDFHVPEEQVRMRNSHPPWPALSAM